MTDDILHGDSDVPYWVCRELEESKSRALEVQADLQALHADHARLSEQFDATQTLDASLRHELKICKRSLKQVCVQLHCRLQNLPEQARLSHLTSTDLKQ